MFFEVIIIITVLTPTYNRASLLKRAFKSLCSQTVFDFEWIIIDDGSTDNTLETVKEFTASAPPFEIVYCHQQNGGKHRAINKGVSLAKGEFVFVLDSDDYLTNDAISKNIKWTDEIKDDDGLAGVAGLRCDPKTNAVIGGRPQKDYIDANYIERIKYRLQGDKAETFKTEIMKKFPYPEFEGENFLRESASWDRIALAGYKLRWHNEIIYYCEYLEDGLTRNTDISRYKKNYNGFTYCVKLQVKNYPFPYNLLKAGHYRFISKKFGISDGKVKDNLNINSFELFFGKLIFYLNKLRKGLTSGGKKN